MFSIINYNYRKYEIFGSDSQPTTLEYLHVKTDSVRWSFPTRVSSAGAVVQAGVCCVSVVFVTSAG